MDNALSSLPSALEVTRSTGTNTNEKEDTQGRAGYQYNTEGCGTPTVENTAQETCCTQESQQRTELACYTRGEGHARSVPLPQKEEEQEPATEAAGGDNSSRDISPIPRDESGSEEISFPGISPSSSALRFKIDDGEVDFGSQNLSGDFPESFAQILRSEPFFRGLADATIVAQQERNRFFYALRSTLERTVAFVQERQHECFCALAEKEHVPAASLSPGRICIRAHVVTEGHAQPVPVGQACAEGGSGTITHQLLHSVTSLRCGAQLELQTELEYFYREVALYLQPFPKWERLGDPHYPYGEQAGRALYAFSKYERAKESPAGEPEKPNGGRNFGEAGAC